MIDLIPIGTVNRTATENNAVKSPDNVKEADKSGRVEADQRQKVDPPRRRFKRRQGERRLAKGNRFGRLDRRKNKERRGDEEEGDNEVFEGSLKAKPAARKGRFIDEQA